ncbi:hypothetical protein HCB27_12525 [Listeria booriae]|uniref:Uncharacterized protein n=1 Tax=Listeria booriae TaxID=1552123 RepID=A0A7X0Z7M5_9LIST|nr:hypothetical protein [Listeria booriae]MBC2177450.1 hypothetical protein [Listeria booriae]
MQIATLANEMFIHMSLSYFQKNNASFFIDTFTTLYPKTPEKILFRALHQLEADTLVSIFHKEDKPYIITLRPNNIRNIDKNTLDKKGYTLSNDVFTFCQSYAKHFCLSF